MPLVTRSLGDAFSRLVLNKPLPDMFRSLLFALRYRLLPLLPHLPRHVRLVRLFGQPALLPLKQRHPSIEYKYLRTYIATELPVKQRLAILRHHYAFLERVVAGDFFIRIFDSRVTLWEMADGDSRYSVALSYPHSLKNDGQKHDQEGDLSLLFEKDGAALYKLNFTIVPGKLFGVGQPSAAFVGCVQGVAGSHDAIKAAAAAMHKAHPAYLLAAAAESIAGSLGITTLLGVSRSRQLCKDDDRYPFNYDQFWEDMGGTQNATGIFVLPVPFPQKPLADIKKPYRQKAARKRTFLSEFARALDARFQSLLRSHGQRSAPGSGQGSD